MPPTQPITSRPRRGLWAGLLAALVLASLWLWSAPWRQERSLRAAPLARLQRLARREPDNARVFYYLGTREEQAGEPGAAYDALTHAADLNADDEPSWLGAAALAGRLHGSQGEHDLLALFLSRHPRSAAAHSALARSYHRRGLYLSAYQEALASATLTPQDADAWRVAGSEAILEQGYPEAEAAGRRAVALRPQDWANQVELGDALRALNRLPEALDCYRQALRLAPDEPAVADSLARALLDQAAPAGDVQEAQALLLRTARRNPEVALTSLLLGQSYERQSHWPEARQALEEAGRRDPRLNEVHFEMARVARSDGDARTAARERSRYQSRLEYETRIYALRLRIAQGSDDVGARLALARLYARAGDRDGAVSQCRRILARYPDSAPARAEMAALTPPPSPAAAPLTARAEALRARGQWKAAQGFYARALAGDHASAPAAQGLGLCLIGEGQPARAFPFLAYSARLNPRLPEAQAAMAALYLDAGFPDEARRRLNIAVKAAPDRADLWHRLGQVEGQADAYSADAEVALARAVALAPASDAYRLDLAEQEAADGRTGAAEADYRRVAADTPRDSDALSRLGGFLLDSSPGRSLEAEALLRRALARDPSNTYARYELGRLALERGDAKAAAAALRAVVARSPDIAEAWYSLGMALKRSGEPAQAGHALAETRRLQQAFQDRVGVQERIALRPLDPALRLRVARLYAENGENAKAFYEYQACLRLAPAQRAVRAEFAALQARLRAQGRLPSMSLYAAMVASMGRAVPRTEPLTKPTP